tara:strand:+ start:402 stop:1646 length:1245 start_codon:yes stop_codon:yes gene_type:complete
MSDNNDDEFSDVVNCKDIIQHLHPINIDELKKYFKERKIKTEPGIYTEDRNWYNNLLKLPEEFEEKRSEDCDLNACFIKSNYRYWDEDGVEHFDDIDFEDDNEYHIDFSEIYKYVNPLTYLIVKNNLLKRPDEKKDLKDAIDLLVKNGADINFHYMTVMPCFFYFYNSPFEKELEISVDTNILDIATQVKNIVAIEKLFEYDDILIRKAPVYSETNNIIGEIALLENVDLFLQLINKIEKTETIDIIDYILNGFSTYKTPNLIYWDRENGRATGYSDCKKDLKKMLGVLILAFKRMNYNSIPQEVQKKLLVYVGDDKELKTFLIDNDVMTKDIATYKRKLRREKIISDFFGKNKVDSIIENKIKEYEGKRAGKTKKRKNKKSKSHKNKTKGKKNKSKSKKKTSLKNYDIYRMPY